MLRVFEPNLGQREANAVHAQVMERRVSPGEKVAEFEAMLCAETGAKHAVCCNSGTTALMLAIIGHTGTIMRAVSHVGVPAYGFLAAANAAAMAGCGLDVSGMKRSYVDGPLDPRSAISMPITATDLCASTPDEAPTGMPCVFISHNGNAARWPAFRDACNWFHAFSIHDAATSLGAFKVDADDRELHALSFSGPKVATCGQGGAIVTNSDGWNERMRELVDHGGGEWRKTRIHENIGGNFRMADLNAALGVAQMHRLPELLGIRRERVTWYREHFPDTRPDGWCMLVRSTKAKECISALAESSYEALQPYRPVQESVPYKNNPVDPEAVRAADELLYLPVHYRVHQSDVDTICRVIKGIDPCSTSN